MPPGAAGGNEILFESKALRPRAPRPSSPQILQLAITTSQSFTTSYTVSPRPKVPSLEFFGNLEVLRDGDWAMLLAVVKSDRTNQIRRQPVPAPKVNL